MKSNYDLNRQDVHKDLQALYPAVTYHQQEKIDRRVWLDSFVWTARVAFIAGLLLLSLLLPALGANAQQDYVNAVVGDGSPGSCTETKFDVALAAIKASKDQDGSISFNCGGPAKITFTSKKYISSQLLVIDGGGEITLSGGKSTTFFEVIAGNLELRNITLVDGYDDYHGGAIHAQNNTSVYLLNSTIRNCRTDAGFGGGAIFSSDTSKTFPSVEIENSIIQFNESGYGAINTAGRLIVRDSVIQGNKGLAIGGGLHVGGLTNIYDTDILDNEAKGVGGGLFILPSGSAGVSGGLIRGNTGTLGGGVYNGGTIVLSNVSVNDNLATNSAGGGLNNQKGTAILSGATFSGNSAPRLGGAIYNHDGTLSIQNSTLANNDIVAESPDHDGSALYSFKGTVTIDNSTLVGQASATNSDEVLYNSGSLKISNTIIFSDVDAGEKACAGDLAKSITYSVVSDFSCGFATGEGNLFRDPLIEPMADNGGPTPTIMIASNSPAIDAGKCGLNTDQRGVARPQGAGCDMGAVERRPNEGTADLKLFLPLAVK